MHATPSPTLASHDATAPPAPAGRRAIDAPMRMFHWLAALSFLGAYLTAEGESWRLVHVTLGYTLAGLLGFRLLYGFLGPRPARWFVLWRRLAALADWVAGLLRDRGSNLAHWRQAQPLLMAWVVAAIMLAVLPLSLSGWANYNDLGGHWLEEVHEFFGNFLLSVVLAHIGLVIVLSLLRRRNLALPMLTGRMEGRGPDLVKRDRRWLAALLLLAVLAFGAWQWGTGAESRGARPRVVRRVGRALN